MHVKTVMVLTKSGQLEELDEYSYCESIHAGPLSPWHIRKLTGGRKLGGGITTNSLCGRVAQGWDLSVPIALGHDRHTCRECLSEYRVATAMGVSCG